MGENIPAAALAVIEPQPLFNPFGLRTTARAAGGGYVLDGVKAMVPRAADGELFIVAAELEHEGPALFVVESKTAGISVEPDPGMGIRAAGTGRLILENVKLPATALLGGADRTTYTECVSLARLGWCAVAVGTGQAALDYVAEYVKDRKAFGESISNRQAVAFTVANMAIELDGLRLATYRAAARVDQGLGVLPGDRPGPSAVRRQGHADRLGRRADAGRSRVHQGTPRRALVPRPAGRRNHGRSSARLMLNLEIPKKFQGLVSQSHQVATEVFRPNSRKYDTAEHERPKELDMLAAVIDGMNESG